MLAKQWVVFLLGRDLAEGNNFNFSLYIFRYLEFLISIYFGDFKNDKEAVFKN